MLPPRRLLGLSLTASAVVLASMPGGWSASASTTSRAVGADPSLPHAAHGQQAIDLLGDELDEAATMNGWTPTQLRSVLATDPTAWVDGHGRVSPPRAGPAGQKQ